MSILNRRVSLDPEGIKYEGDSKHQETIRKDLGLEGANPVTTPGTKIEAKGESPDDGKLMEPQEVREYRGIAARGNFLGQDRPDLAFAAKEAYRKMSCPAKSDNQLLKRIGRYLQNMCER